MTLDAFENSVIEELNTFIADWRKARSMYGDYNFPNSFPVDDWWKLFRTYDKDRPYAEREYVQE
jgi:hypothetical protein